MDPNPGPLPVVGAQPPKPGPALETVTPAKSPSTPQQPVVDEKAVHAAENNQISKQVPDKPPLPKLVGEFASSLNLRAVLTLCLVFFLTLFFSSRRL